MISPWQFDSELDCRLDHVLESFTNMTCADCPAKHPQWVSFLYARIRVGLPLAVLCCDKCAQHHFFELGNKRCMIKSLKLLHEWTLEDVEIVEFSGNAIVNAIFEANLTHEEFEKADILEDDVDECNRRGRFIKNKYKKRCWIDTVQYNKMMLELMPKEGGYQRPASRSDEKTDIQDEDYETRRVTSLSDQSVNRQDRYTGNYQVRNWSHHRRGNRRDSPLTENKCSANSRETLKPRASRRSQLNRCSSDPTAIKKGNQPSNLVRRSSKQ